MILDGMTKCITLMYMLNKRDRRYCMDLFISIKMFTIQTFVSIIAPNYVNDMKWHNHNADKVS